MAEYILSESDIRIGNLEAENAKLKCCGNCEYWVIDWKREYSQCSAEAKPGLDFAHSTDTCPLWTLAEALK